MFIPHYIQILIIRLSSQNEMKRNDYNETIINVMSNYIPNEIKVFDDQKPPWMNAEIENLITAKNDVV